MKRILAHIRVLGALGFLLAVQTPNSYAQGSSAAFFQLRAGSETFDDVCSLEFYPGVVTIRVDVYAVPFQRARFTLPDPPIGTVAGETWGVSYTGDRVNGLEVDMGGCTDAGWVTIGYMYILVQPEETILCTPWNPGSECEVQDCDGVWLPAVAPDFYTVEDISHTNQCLECFQQCFAEGPLPAYDLYPPDGATAVPVDVVLTWVGQVDSDPLPYPQDFTGCRVTVGTEPDLSGVTQGGEGYCNSFAPVLQPNTTYYWSAGWYDNTTWCGNIPWAGYSRVYSFTTEGPSPVTPTTWGRVKALYRD